MDYKNEFKKEQVVTNQFVKEEKTSVTTETKGETTVVENVGTQEITTSEKGEVREVELIKKYRLNNMILKLIEFTFILSIIFIPCFVAKMQIEGQYYNISYGFIDVFGLFVERLKAGSWMSLIYDLITFYLVFMIIIGGLGSFFSALGALKNRNKIEVDKEELKPNNNTKKKKGNMIVTIVIVLGVGYAINYIDFPYLNYIASSLYYSVNLFIAVPVLILVAYIVYCFKTNKIKKEILKNEK